MQETTATKHTRGASKDNHASSRLMIRGWLAWGSRISAGKRYDPLAEEFAGERFSLRGAELKHGQN